MSYAPYWQQQQAPACGEDGYYAENGYCGEPYRALGVPIDHTPMENIIQRNTQRYIPNEDYEDEEEIPEKARVSRTPPHTQFTLILSLVAVTFCFIALSSFTKGSLAALSTPRNYQGLACGLDNPVEDLRYLFLPLDPSDGKALRLQPSRALCVKSCPTIADVEKGGFVRIPEAFALEAKNNAAFVTVLHPIRSPVYATEVNHNLCVPIQDDIKQQATRAFSMNYRRGGYLKQLAVSLMSIIPETFILLLLSLCWPWINYTILTWYPRFGLTANFTLGCSLLAFTGLRFLWLTMSTGGAASLTFPGVACLAAAAASLVWFKSRQCQLDRASKVLGIADGLSKDAECADFQGPIVVLQLMAIVTSLASVVTFCLSQSNLESRTTPIRGSVDANGGLDISPLDRDFSANASIQSQLRNLLLVFATVWLIETIATLAEYLMNTVARGFYLKAPWTQESGATFGMQLLRNCVEIRLGTCAYLALMKPIKAIKSLFNPVDTGNPPSSATIWTLAMFGGTWPQVHDQTERVLNDESNQAAVAHMQALEFASTIDHYLVGSVAFAVFSFGATTTMLSRSQNHLSAGGCTPLLAAAIAAVVFERVARVVPQILWSFLGCLVYTAAVENYSYKRSGCASARCPLELAQVLIRDEEGPKMFVKCTTFDARTGPQMPRDCDADLFNFEDQQVVDPPSL